MACDILDSSETVAARPRSKKQRYIAVPVAILTGLIDLRCDLYIQHAMSSQKLLYRSGSYDLPIADDENLVRQNVRHLFLRVEDEWIYEQALRDALAAPPLDPALSLTISVEYRRSAFQSALISNTVAPLVEASAQLSQGLLTVIQQDDFCVSKVVGLLSHDRCTFQHSCNVAIYASTLAKRLGLGDRDLELLATGALLHDIGKRQIPGFILRNPSKLNKHELELIRKHPTTGFQELATISKLQWNQLMMVYQHHEWINGRGYPVGSAGEEIHLWARICAIADVFDALTANRPYRKTDFKHEALQIMNNDTGHFDPLLLSLWNEVVSQ